MLKKINSRRGARSTFIAVGSFSEGEQGEDWAGEPSCTQERDVIEWCDRQDDGYRAVQDYDLY